MENGSEPLEDGSEQLDNPAYERFAQACASGVSLAEAYREAGYADDRRHAHRLWATNGDIRNRASYLRREARAAFVIDRDEALDILAGIARNPAEAGKTRVAALGTAGKWLGLEKGTEAENKSADALRDLMQSIILRNGTEPV